MPSLSDLYEEGEKADALLRDRSGFRSFNDVLISVVGRWRDSYAEDGGCDEQFQLALSELPDRLRDPTRKSFERAKPICESPIELRILPWLLCQRYQFFPHDPLVLLAGESDKLRPRSIALIPQLPIGKYRVDFALAASLGGPVRFVVIECDGAEFHDNEHDMRRDAGLLRNPRILFIARLKGWEIWRDPKKAAAQITRVVIDAWSKRTPRIG
jgi:very-short-patch-repair endonuclease